MAVPAQHLHRLLGLFLSPTLYCPLDDPLNPMKKLDLRLIDIPKESDRKECSDKFGQKGCIYE